LGGLLAFGVGVWNLTRSLQSAHWPASEGTILSGEIKYRTSSIINDNTHNYVNNIHDDASYSAEITYRYQVAENDYTGTRLAYGAWSSSAAYAQGVLARYPNGKKVSVYYSPSHPEQAVLEPGIHGGTWICFVVGVVFIFAGTGLRLLFKMTGAQ
jgi:hypothetical protein